MGKSQSTKSEPGKGGFQNNNVYRFISMKDKNVIELPGFSTSSGAPVVVAKTRTTPNQKFLVVQTSAGEFQISSLVQDSDAEAKQVWDFMPGDSRLIQNAASTGGNQLWMAEEIYPNSMICLIKSKIDGRCLRNMGVGMQLGLASEDRRDPHLHWKLETTF